MDTPLDTKELTDILLHHYNLHLVSADHLPSLTDINYHIKAKPADKDGHVGDYTLKETHQGSPQQMESLAVQAAMMGCLSEKGFLCSEMVPTIQGDLMWIYEPMPEAEKGAEQSKVIQLLTYVPGETLSSCPFTPNLLRDVGEMLAGVKDALQGFQHRNLPMLSPGEAWDRENFPGLLEEAQQLKDEEERDLVIDVLNSFIEQFECQLHSLSTSIQHGDLHPANFILSQKCFEVNPSQKARQRLAILDFSLASCSFTMFDLAVTLSTFMMATPDDQDFLETGGHILSGYLRVRSISDVTWGLLPVSCCVQYCKSLMLTRSMPEEVLSAIGQDSYVARVGRNVGSQLRILRDMSAEDILTRWKIVCKQLS